MGNTKDDDLINGPDGVLPGLSVFVAIVVQSVVVRVVEYRDSLVEGDLVLAQVRTGFRAIPLELHSLGDGLLDLKVNVVNQIEVQPDYRSWCCLQCSL